MVALGFTVLAVQAALAIVSYGRFNLILPMLVLFVIATMLFFSFLSVGGESDALQILVVMLAPVTIGAIVIAGVVEYAVRLVVGA